MSGSPAVVFDPDTGLGIRGVSVRQPRDGEVAVEIHAAGVCHSDLHVVDGDWPTEKPLVLGHEASGVVSATGPGTALSEGDRVVLSWFAPCRHCVKCLSGRPWLCNETRAVENTLPDGSTAFSDEQGEVWPYLGLGAFTRKIVVPEAAAIPVPGELPFEIGALLGCAITTGVGAVVNTADVGPGESAIVIGCGGVGLAIVMGLRLIGADPIVAVDLSDERLEAARRFGATHTLSGDQIDVGEWCRSELGGADYAFEAIGHPGLIESLPGMLTSGGAAVLVGMTAIDAKASIDPFDLADQGKQIIGCNYGSSNGAIDIPRLARLYLTGHLPLGELVGQTRPLSETAQAFADLRSGTGMRTIIVP